VGPSLGPGWTCLGPRRTGPDPAGTLRWSSRIVW